MARYFLDSLKLTQSVMLIQVKKLAKYFENAIALYVAVSFGGLNKYVKYLLLEYTKCGSDDALPIYYFGSVTRIIIID